PLGDETKNEEIAKKSGPTDGHIGHPTGACLNDRVSGTIPDTTRYEKRRIQFTRNQTRLAAKGIFCSAKNMRIFPGDGFLRRL
ncbi:hypothetical protein JW777_04395, partial [bacterium]|nr:hypothetical protein [bacterium]